MSGVVKKAIRITVGVGGYLGQNVPACVFTCVHCVSVGTLWYANPTLKMCVGCELRCGAPEPICRTLSVARGPPQFLPLPDCLHILLS